MCSSNGRGFVFTTKVVCPITDVRRTDMGSADRLVSPSNTKKTCSQHEQKIFNAKARRGHWKTASRSGISSFVRSICLVPFVPWTRSSLPSCPFTSRSARPPLRQLSHFLCPSLLSRCERFFRLNPQRTKTGKLRKQWRRAEALNKVETGSPEPTMKRDAKCKRWCFRQGATLLWPSIFAGLFRTLEDWIGKR